MIWCSIVFVNSMSNFWPCCKSFKSFCILLISIVLYSPINVPNIPVTNAAAATNRFSLGGVLILVILVVVYFESGAM